MNSPTDERRTLATRLALSAVLLCTASLESAAQPYTVDWRVVAGGGHGPSSAGGFSVQGTFG